MSVIIDRRTDGKSNSSSNRGKFLRRHRAAIKEAVADAVKNRDIKNFKKDGKSISIDRRSIEEHPFTTDKKNRREVRPGNPRYIKGTKIPIDKQGKGRGNKGGNGEDSEGDFLFDVTKEELLEFFLDDLELPHLTKRALMDTEEYKYKRAGYISYGIPSNLNLLRSCKNALSRRIAMKSSIESEKTEDMDEEAIKLIEERKEKVPFLTDMDLKYNLFLPEAVPTTAAVMFCVMDVSGSMSTYKRDLAKRFYILLYLLLVKNYQRVELVFISHTTTAHEVTEEEFFHGSPSGGTYISSGLKLAKKIQEERYPTDQYNIYLAQAGDGENFEEDDNDALMSLKSLLDVSQSIFVVNCVEDGYRNIFSNSRLQFTQYFTTVQAYADVKNTRVFMGTASTPNEIYPLFRKFFEKRLKL